MEYEGKTSSSLVLRGTPKQFRRAAMPRAIDPAAARRVPMAAQSHWAMGARGPPIRGVVKPEARGLVQRPRARPTVKQYARSTRKSWLWFLRAFAFTKLYHSYNKVYCCGFTFSIIFHSVYIILFKTYLLFVVVCRQLLWLLFCVWILSWCFVNWLFVKIAGILGKFII